MAKLILSMDGLVLKEIPLSKERTTIGRKAHNDIQIDNLAVSGEHAVIVTILNDSFMEDLGSTNGTLVNGNPVKKHFLQNNDVIELGKYKLKFIQEAGAQPAAAAADFEKTMVLRPSAMKAAAEQAKAAGMGGAQAAQAARQAAVQASGQAAQSAGIGEKPAAPAATPAAAPPTAAPAVPAAIAPAATAPRPAQPLGAIQLLSGGNAGKELELAKPLTTLGKPGVQVAVLTRRPQGYFITHVEGAQRPTVNGQPIGTAPHALKDHDLVEIAGIKMEFFHKN
jgi:pSer/pThr/pTyr-binding forkhead associated (FHA) protein